MRCNSQRGQSILLMVFILGGVVFTVIVAVMMVLNQIDQQSQRITSGLKYELGVRSALNVFSLRNLRCEGGVVQLNPFNKEVDLPTMKVILQDVCQPASLDSPRAVLQYVHPQKQIGNAYGWRVLRVVKTLTPPADDSCLPAPPGGCLALNYEYQISVVPKPLALPEYPTANHQLSFQAFSPVSGKATAGWDPTRRSVFVTFISWPWIVN